MSSAMAMVRFGDGTVLYGQYQGTSDVMLSELVDTHEELSRRWRDLGWKECSHPASGGGREFVHVWTQYGSGFHWWGVGCRRCKALVSGHMPYDGDGADREDGTPEWAREELEKEEKS